MESTTLKISQNDGYSTRLFCFPTSQKTVSGTVLLLHGMAEHLERYEDFICRLTKEGLDVYIYDHRGHGTNKNIEELGFVSSKNGAALLVEDALTVCRYIRANARNQKFAIMGHSMGSIILRCLLQQYDDFDCAIVCASAMPPRIFSQAGTILADLVCKLHGADKRSEFLQKAMFGGKAYTSLCTRTNSDWLTRNQDIVDDYIADPYCGFTCTASFYRDLTQLSNQAARKKSISNTRKDLPILFLAGTKDPVGGYAVRIKKLHGIFLRMGFTDASLITYPEARHELLNEQNRDEVYQDILSFLHKTLSF